MVDVDTFLTQASPYRRSTYRYSPIMAYLVMPNLLLGPLYGKLLFSICNLLTAWLMRNILIYRNVESKARSILLALWMLNPLAIQVATRGNADSFMTFLVAALLYTVLKERPIIAGFCLGLGVHVKIYPALYAFPLLITWNDTWTLRSFKQDLVGEVQLTPNSTLWRDLMKTTVTLSFKLMTLPLRLIYCLLRRLNTNQWLFGMTALLTFAIMTGGFYLRYGWTFLYETYLYHGVRHDHRHNFSPFSAWATLVTPRRDPTEDIGNIYGTISHFKAVQKLAQLPLTLLLGFAFIKPAPELSVFLQTAWFVTFNSVSTAQYFVWYLALLPLALGTSKRVQSGSSLRLLWLGLLAIMIIWIGTDLHWVYWSHRFEFKGESDAFLGLFVASWAFTGASILLINFVFKWSQDQSSSELIKEE
eukprot:Blabericola_migrator_1__12394@NODE_779_length_6557_cov_102_591217_g554_i0_p2_GENE_NODE_779_length_6557_cov_102_591217_g554_i0NODE_779_length_6557_cov_102_591217_g554_i0_p2_ORF_typecomplete_len417_score27_76Mannosyl_trans/PF05007_13/1_5e03Mannosyl_trans/PF05007_13/4_4e65PIGU/PF06728_13/1_9e28PIGU/PF06728_13/1_6GT87/PF09594_10/3_7e16GT87/PF09594_10/1_8e04PMT_2/PF13231_6/6_5e08PMT_2/PF13231_6/3_4PMT_2/PF13231_6/1_1e04_NODE_779_length_6557_cov_102_591217_g554_i02561506